jgi:hypothetical protein
VSMRNVVAVAALLATTSAAAAESPRLGSFEFTLSGYHPSIDQEFVGRGGATPYATAFGGGRGLMFRAGVARSLFISFGTLDVGLGAGYFEKYGHGLLPDGSRAGDSTAFKVVPIRVSLTYRFDYLATQYNIPLAPYARASLERYQWWVTNGAGSTANASGLSGSGATNGYSFSAGLALLLNFFDPGVAREMDRDLGINQTYIFVDATKSYIKDFGSSGSWNLSDENVTLAGGLLFVF